MPRMTLPVGERDHRQGPDDAPVTLVEYGDYECPHCGTVYRIIKSLRERLGDQMRFVYRNFPLATIHPHAEPAAEAAEAAGGQGRFWEMHDTLFENQAALENRDLRQYAADLGLDTGQFERDLAGHAYAGRIREDFLSGVRSGVNGTPTLFINGARYDGSWDEESLLASLAEAAGDTM